MRYTYFLITENKTEKERAELDETLSDTRASASPSKVLQLGGEVRTTRRTT